MMTPDTPVCAHHPDMVTASEFYRHCSDCGAVAEVARLGGRVRPGVWRPWHTCETCRTPGPYRDGAPPEQP